MIQEFNLAKEHGIEITSILLWLNAKRDSIGKLSPSNQELLNNLKMVDQKPTIWISFSDNYFEKINNDNLLKNNNFKNKYLIILRFMEVNI